MRLSTGHAKGIRAAAVSALFAATMLSTAAPSRAADDTISPQVEGAVDRGLEVLARTQKQNGSWSNNGAPVAITGLAAMAFMARGHVPGQGQYGEVLNHAIDYILAAQQTSGLLAEGNPSQPMYDHGICTMALCEAYGMLDERRQEKARTAISQAVRLILDAQNVHKPTDDQGGWRYNPKASDSDTSVTGWQLMALRGAKNIGAFLPSTAIEAGIAYMTRHKNNDGSFGYIRSGDRGNTALTGTGVLTLILLGESADSRTVLAGGEFLLTHEISANEHYYYATYYCSQAAWQLGGKFWTILGPKIAGNLLAKQKPDGSWGEAAGSIETSQPYATSMAILALTVPYRYLPIYQR